MKKTYLFFLVFTLFITTSYAQFTVSKQDGTPIANNAIIEFTTQNTLESEMYFYVTNNSTEELDFRLRCIDLINATGLNFQACFGYECLAHVTIGGIYPDYQNLVAAGDNTLARADNLKNFNAGDGVNYPMDHTFRIFTKDLAGNIVGANFNMTYRYQGPLSLEQKDKLSNMGIKVLNTSVTNYVGLEINKEVNYSLISIQGQTILSGNAASNFNLDLSSLQTGLYFLMFQNNEGLADSVKIYKK